MRTLRTCKLFWYNTGPPATISRQVWDESLVAVYVFFSCDHIESRPPEGHPEDSWIWYRGHCLIENDYHHVWGGGGDGKTISKYVIVDNIYIYIYIYMFKWLSIYVYIYIYVYVYIPHLDPWGLGPGSFELIEPRSRLIWAQKAYWVRVPRFWAHWARVQGPFGHVCQPVISKDARNLKSQIWQIWSGNT